MPTRFKNEVAQILCLPIFRLILWVGGHIANDGPPPTQKSVVMPLDIIMCRFMNLLLLGKHLLNVFWHNSLA